MVQRSGLPRRADVVLSVREDGATAQAVGATGVPFFVVDRKYGAAGCTDDSCVV